MANGVKHMSVTNKDLYEAIKEVNQNIDDNFVRKVEFEPVRKLVYGVVGAVLMTVVGAILALVVQKGV